MFGVIFPFFGFAEGGGEIWQDDVFAIFAGHEIIRIHNRPIFVLYKDLGMSAPEYHKEVSHPIHKRTGLLCLQSIITVLHCIMFW